MILSPRIMPGDTASKPPAARFAWTRSTRDAIEGHAPRTEGEDYGEVPPDVMLYEILKLPRYRVAAAERRDGRRGRKAKAGAQRRIWNRPPKRAFMRPLGEDAAAPLLEPEILNP